MNLKSLSNILQYVIAAVWLANGLFCKVLNLIPRHQEIVARILGEEYASIFTILIGFSEIAMAIWILSKYFWKLNAILQIGIIILMNILEFILAPDLLLWGRFNILFALLFALLIYYQNFVLKPKISFLK
ncbi:DoxX-like family protein [Frigoriflavimonas asaccharolytica]|uniref:DoxX-like protein n=1 Tax=Frigoriflavimonas asaccharolytica TaxID=2735899 RepID=A0A8J8K9A1_9FLAO|nr:DoxX-like family protein [Frigoriflavimonas asaccharolytica]NRS93391.1 hypothetical protein [Frigoriflavimonas asaccharolytica]